MDTYEVSIEPLQPKLIHKVIAALVLVLLYGAIFFLVRISLSGLFPAPAQRHGGLDRFVADGALAFMILILGWVVMYSILNKPGRTNKRRDFRIVVEADSIAAVYPKSRRIVHKGKIHSIFEVKASSLRPGGIGISEKTEFAARMLGFVFVPNTLAEFDKLKTLAESWRRS